MVVVTGRYPQAQLVGLQGLATLVTPQIRMAAMPPGISAQVQQMVPTITQDSSAGPTNYGTTAKAGDCIPGVSTPCACADGTTGTAGCGATGLLPCVCKKPTNWLLWGGLALGAVVLWKVL